MTTSSDPVLDKTLECIKLHCKRKYGDRNLLDAFNRLLAKNVNPPGRTNYTHLTFRPDQIQSRQEKWTTHQLSQLDRGHSAVDGDDFDCPIVIAEYEGKQRVLDGNHRINRWIASGDTRLHDVHIHTIVAVGQYVELPPVAT